MKKYIALILLLIGFIASVCLADSLKPPAYQGVRRPEITQTWLNAVTATGSTSGIVDLGMTVGKGNCVLTATGTTATTFTVSMLTGITASKVATSFSHTYTVGTSGSDAFYFANKPARFWGTTYDSRTGGDASSAITVQCTHIQE